MSLYEWKKVWLGSAQAYMYREGRATATVRPDFEKGCWYWSVHWPKSSSPPKKNPDGTYDVTVSNAKTVWGKTTNADDAKEAAIKALLKGRFAEESSA